MFAGIIGVVEEVSGAESSSDGQGDTNSFGTSITHTVRVLEDFKLRVGDKAMNFEYI